jgi:hypothetical protein
MRVVVLLTLFLTTATPAREATTFIPWAWERREDLRFLGKHHTVAYYAGIITLARDKVIVAPRRNPLFLADDTHRIAVIRIETNHATLSKTQHDATIAAILRLFRDAEELQIDFDAAGSEREFYRAMLVALRPRIRAPLSLTALTSWCMDDRWLAALPIDEAVPMLFRMGHDAPRVREGLARGDAFREERCRGSAGISLDEPLARIPRARRVWVFNPKPWTEERWNTIAN